MKKLILFLGLFCSLNTVFAQILDPVHWTFSSEKINDTEANVLLTATIDPGWHIYAVYLKGDGPIPTSFTFTKSGDYSTVGKVVEPKPQSAFDPNFGTQIAWHSKKATFKQKIKLNKPNAVVKGTLEFMVCNDRQCLPPSEVEFSIPVSGTAQTAVAPAEEPKIGTPAPGASATVATAPAPEKNAPPASSIKPAGPSATAPVATAQQSGSLWAIFLTGLVEGILAFLMPCIYPMVPLTVSYFTKKSGSRAKAIRSASVYGLSIIGIYVALGLLVSFLFGASALNEAASSATFNLIFFVILIIFAMSFLGAFEITLPSSIVNKADEKSNTGGLAGMFFMAFTLVLISFSCTGPLIGSLLVEAVSKGTYLGPAVGMFGFALSLAIPFTLFAIFPSLLKELPKSGGWLNTVKVSLGFLELALALKYLSNVDLAYHWQLLDRNVFIVLWIVIFGMLSLYLLGKIRFSHDSELSFISLPRLFIAMLFTGFTIYMIPGLWGAPLNAVSAWLPPPSVRDFTISASASNATETAGRKYAGLFHAPHGIDAFYDYEEGLAYAKKVNKPVMLDFTGWSCTNCRKMEASVWSDPEVLRRLKEDYVLISLYVDDKTELAANEKYTTTAGKKVKTIGQKWSDFQASTFNTNSQPYYVLVDTEGKPLVPPQAFNLDINNYIQFLDSGKSAFSK